MFTADFATFRTELRRLRRGRTLHLALIAAGYWLALLLLWCMLLMTLDVFLGRFWSGIRYGGFAGLVLFCAGAVYYAWRLLRTPRGDEAAALLVGRAFPGSGDNLINAVQLARMGYPDEYISSVLSESPLLRRPVHITDLYSSGLRKGCIRLLLLTAVLSGVFSLVYPRSWGSGLGRILQPWSGSGEGALTQILSVKPGNAVLKRGEKLVVSCRLGGRLPEEARLEFSDHRGRDHVLTARGEGLYQTESPLAVESGRYRVHAGDSTSSWYEIRLVSPPSLLEWRASVVPPAVTGRSAYELHDGSREWGVPADSRIRFQARATEKLTRADCLQNGQRIASAQDINDRKFSLDFILSKQGEAVLELSGETAGRVTLPLVVIPDRLPRIMLQDTALRQQVRRGSPVPVRFRAEDDYGILQVGLERVMSRGRPVQIAAARPEKSSGQQVFEGRFVVDTGSFDCKAGDVLRIRCWAGDGLDPSRRAYSPVIELQLPAGEPAEAREKSVRSAKAGLEELLRLQKSARGYCDRSLSRALAGGRPVGSGDIQDLQKQQSVIREKAAGLLQNRQALGGLADQLAGLVNLEMMEILHLLEGCFRLSEKKRLADWQKVLVLQTRIIAVLSGVSGGLDQESILQNRQDFYAMIQRMIKEQRKVVKETRALQENQPVVLPALVHNQELLAESLQFFQDRCLSEAARLGGDDFAGQLRRTAKIIGRDEIYEKMLCAAEELENRRWPAALQLEEKILKSLMKVMTLLNRWRMNQAKKILEKAGDTLARTADVLSELEKKQARIAEVTRDLKSRGLLDDETREKLAAMDREQEEMADQVEKLANDLYQFPELPVCGELNSRMREIFEDVEQAADSENTPALEIAVQKEDALLDAIRSTTKRIEDVEMWLPDVPDNIVWNMESFDTDEFPDMPLVPLPDELEDIVGDLLEQESSIDAQSQDTTGNNMVADMEMGWSIMDGPMPSFAAKGKSGNTRPNDNEMTGRSGSGREGQASGELVENHVKGYEGRKTHARRTMDQFQKGMVTEDENSTADARATGGGKLGGESETQGMFGAAPRRDLHTGSHGVSAVKIRQETEALYATARLLYLGTGSLGAAARDMRRLEQAPPGMKELGGIRRRVMRQLSDSQVEMRDGVVLPMPVSEGTAAGGFSEKETSYDRVSGEYRELLKDYYRSLR